MLIERTGVQACPPADPGGQMSERPSERCSAVKPSDREAERCKPNKRSPPKRAVQCRLCGWVGFIFLNFFFYIDVLYSVELLRCSLRRFEKRHHSARCKLINRNREGKTAEPFSPEFFQNARPKKENLNFYNYLNNKDLFECRILNTEFL